MNDSRTQLIKELFQAAVELPDEARADFLTQRCADDGTMRAAVERLLAADGHIQPGGFLRGSSDNIAEPIVPKRIGRFNIVRLIGEGGMGSVFEAEQEQPRRRVALKVIRSAVLTPALVRRFEYEVHILGRLRHPGIAQVYEAGTHDDGGGALPYFAMEFVDGRPLLNFVREQSVDIPARLRLMSEICDAVHHAHQKGVIHRDLKPANILVEGDVAAGFRARILDFGVARAVHSDVQLVTMHTEAGALIGTLSYMSPEQMRGQSDEVDIRSDVYSLGVILYEMLSGKPPHDLRGRSIIEAGTIIRDQEPTRLGRRDPSLRGDLETLVAKAMARERDRRYASAAAFGDDIRRYLGHEPIVARPATRAYQLRMFAQRNRSLVGGILAVFMVLVLAFLGTSLALVRATRAERLAVQRSVEADSSAARATAVSNFLQSMLAGVDPEEIGQRPITVREVLDHAAGRLEHELVNQPAVAASVHQTLGMHYRTLGHYADADRHFREAVALRRSLAVGDDPELADALNNLAVNLYEKRDLAEVEGLTREALDMRRRLFGAINLEVAGSLYGLASILVEVNRADEAEPLIRESLMIQRRLLGAEHSDVATSIGTLGWCLMALNRLDEAETAMRDAVEMVRRLPGDHERALAARLTFLSGVLRARGKLIEEEAALREAIDIRSRRLPEEHPAFAWNLFCLARVRWKLADYDEAEAACRRALDIYLKRRGPEHTDIADCQQLLAQIYDAQGRYVEAESWWKACLEMRRNLLPAEHPETQAAESGLVNNRSAPRDVYTTLEIPP